MITPNSQNLHRMLKLYFGSFLISVVLQIPSVFPVRTLEWKTYNSSSRGKNPRVFERLKLSCQNAFFCQPELLIDVYFMLVFFSIQPNAWSIRLRLGQTIIWGQLFDPPPPQTIWIVWPIQQILDGLTDWPQHCSSWLNPASVCSKPGGWAENGPGTQPWQTGWVQQAHRQERNYNRARLEGYNPGYNPSVKWPITRNDAMRIGRRQKKPVSTPTHQKFTSSPAKK